jgi:hypothetical protein
VASVFKTQSDNNGLAQFGSGRGGPKLQAASVQSGCAELAAGAVLVAVSVHTPAGQTSEVQRLAEAMGYVASSLAKQPFAGSRPPSNLRLTPARHVVSFRFSAGSKPELFAVNLYWPRVRNPTAGGCAHAFSTT